MDNLIYPVTSLLCISALTEVILEVIKGSIPNLKYEDTTLRIASVIVSIIIAAVLGVSIFPVTGAAYYCGIFFSGLIASRGANFIHSFGDTLHCISEVKKLNSTKKNNSKTKE